MYLEEVLVPIFYMNTNLSYQVVLAGKYLLVYPQDISDLTHLNQNLCVWPEGKFETFVDSLSFWRFLRRNIPF